MTARHSLRTSVPARAADTAAPTFTVSRPGDAHERAAEHTASGAEEFLRTGSQVHFRPTLARARSVHATAQSLVRSLGDGGAPLQDSERHRFERALGHDLSHVRVHTGPSAHRSAHALRATAYAVGPHVVFSRGAFAPGTAAGRRLLAHELAHTLQPGDGRAVMRTAAAGEYAPEGKKEEEEETRTVLPEEQGAAVMRQPAADDSLAEGTAAPAVDSPPAPEPLAEPGAEAQPMQAGGAAAPTISLSPATLTRGQTLTATVAFKPPAGEKLDVTGWSYATTNHGTVTRPTTDPDFQNKWEGVMAQSGTLSVSFRVTPSGGTQGAEQSVDAAVTVADRTGAPWQSTVEETKEGTLTGKPSPPKQFSDLGYHGTNANPLPGPKSTPIKSGPNAGISFAGSLTAGKFTSDPLVHPDAKKVTSTFYKFHATPSRLYLTSTPKRKLIPNADYSKLDLKTGVDFEVPDWEAFYKKHAVYALEITFNDKTVKLKDAWWGLAKNDRQSDIEVRDWPAIRRALGANDTDRLPAPTVTPAGGWAGFNLMPGASILAGTRSHEFGHAVHSHRANFKKMMKALDPAREIEHTVGPAGETFDFQAKILEFWNEIVKPDHEIVDETESVKKKEFVAEAGKKMAGVNTDPDNGTSLGSVWNITDDDAMK